MNVGIYTQSTMKAFQQHTMFPQEVEAAQNNLPDNFWVTKQSIKGSSFISLLMNEHLAH